MEKFEVANQDMVIRPYVEVEDTFRLVIYHLQRVVFEGHACCLANASLANFLDHAASHRKHEGLFRIPLSLLA